MTESQVLGIVGATGNLGHALARRWSKTGIRVLIGSRSAESAQAAAAALSADVRQEIGWGTNRDVAERADLVVVTVPWAAQADTLQDIKRAVDGKIVVDTTVPLVPPKVMRVQLPAEGCAALRAQSILGVGVNVVSAFHSVAAHKLATDSEIDCDVLVFGDDKQARGRVVQLADAAGLRGIHGGSLANSVAAEALTSVLIFINKNYQVDGAGVRITGRLIDPAPG
jgi:8-hydroxy-5-deazaflavin:NADPH oxidoreductase